MMDLDLDFREISERMSSRLKSEHDRLSAISVKLLNGGMSIQYRRNAEFDQKLAELLAIQIGRYEVIDDTTTTKPATDVSAPPRGLAVENSHPDSFRYFTTECLNVEAGSNKSSLNISASRENNNSQIRKRPHQHPYENMKLVAVIEEGKFPVNLSKVSSVVALPEMNCFAVKHGKRISLISPSGEYLLTYTIAFDKSERLRPGTYCPNILVRNPTNGQLICIDNGRITSIEPIELPDESGAVIAKERIKHNSKLPLGLAISGTANRLFSAFGSYVETYSISTWSYRDTFHLEMPDAKFGPFVLGVHGNQLFYREDSCNHSLELYSVPFDDDGKIATSRWKVVAQNFLRLRGISFDHEGNIFAADSSRCRIEVFASDGSELLATINPPRSCNISFNPEEVAVLSVPPSNPYLFGSVVGNERIKSFFSSVVAAVDFQANRVLLFASPPPSAEGTLRDFD